MDCTAVGDFNKGNRMIGERKFVGLALDEVEPDGVFSGYASLFARWTSARTWSRRALFRRR